MKIFVTGAAGFIGYHVSKMLLERGDEVIGFDSINDYYEISLKYGRLSDLGIDRTNEDSNRVQSSLFPSFSFIKGNLQDNVLLEKIFKKEKFDTVCHLAAQAGVRYSLENPRAYIDTNIGGFLNILEACRNFSVHNLVYASSSSVYGLNEKVPFSVKDNVDRQVSLYAVTKKSNELMAYTYSHLYGIATTGLRFFTVYGPWGRPDMAPILFARAITSGEKLKVFNYGKMERDFTYIDDIVNGVITIIDNPIEMDKSLSRVKLDIVQENTPYRVFNIGNGQPVILMKFIETLETALGRKAVLELMPMQPGDVVRTWADLSCIEEAVGYQPKISIKEGIDRFVRWFLKYEESNK